MKYLLIRQVSNAKSDLDKRQQISILNYYKVDFAMCGNCR